MYRIIRHTDSNRKRAGRRARDTPSATRSYCSNRAEGVRWAGRTSAVSTAGLDSRATGSTGGPTGRSLHPGLDELVAPHPDTPHHPVSIQLHVVDTGDMCQVFVLRWTL